MLKKMLKVYGLRGLAYKSSFGFSQHISQLATNG